MGKRVAMGMLLLVFVGGCSGEESGDPTTTVLSLGPTTATSFSHATTTSSGPITATAQAQSATTSTLDPATLQVESFPVPSGSRPHDVAPAIDGGVWYTAQNLGDLGWLDPDTGETRHISLGAGSRPHGVIVDDAGTPWVTDGGLNAMVSVDPVTGEVSVYRLPDDAHDANLNTAVFDDRGILWFTGQQGFYGRLDPANGELTVEASPEGRGPYGITHAPNGTVFFASLAGSYIGEIDSGGGVIVREPPTPEQGARRVWADSMSRVWVSEWNSGQVSRYDPAKDEWATWALPGDDPSTYAVYVDDQDIVWLSDFGGNAIVRFDPATETFTPYPLPHDPGNVRQILGRPGEVWGAESAADNLVLIRTR